MFFFPDSREDWEVTFKKFNLFNACVLFVIAICYNQGYMTLRWNYFDKELAQGGFEGGPRGFPIYKLMKPAALVKDTIR